MASTPLVAWMNPLPMELAPALSAQRCSLAANSTGRVLDLGGWGDHLADYPIGDAVRHVTMLDRSGDVRAGTGQSDPAGVTRLDVGVDTLVEQGVEPFDTIVSLIRTPLVEDLARFLHTVTALMRDDGQLLMLEPVGRAGGFGRLLAVGARLSRAAGGLHLDRDIPAELRSCGLVITDLDRFEVPTVSAPFRPFVAARARWPVSSG